jgi:hypothetical protein
MPFLTKTAVLSGSAPSLYTSGAEVVAQRGSITAATADVALNSVGAFVILPAGCVPVGIHIDADAAVAADVGVLDNAESAVSTAAADGGAVWAAALAANGSSFAFSRAMARVAASSVDRKIGVKVTTAGTAGVVGMTMQYRAA